MEQDGAYAVGYVAGQVIVLLLLFGGGLALLIAGRKARQATQVAPAWAPTAWAPTAWAPPNPALPTYPPPAAPAPAVPAPAASDYFAPPLPTPPVAPPPAYPPDPYAALTPPKPKGRKRTIGGIVLLVLGALAALGMVSDRARVDTSGTTVSLPPALLGLARNDADVAEDRADLLKTLPSYLDQADLGMYGKRPGALLVIAARGKIRFPSSELRGFERGAQGQGLTFDEGHDQAGGALGGKVRCWAVTKEVHVIVCAMISSTSMVATFDFVAADVPSGAARALTIREAVVTQS